MYYAARRNHNGRKLEMDSHCRGINYDYSINSEFYLKSQYDFLGLRRKIYLFHLQEGNYTNCYTGNLWDPTICPDAATCTENCALDGIDAATWNGTYGVKKPDDNSLSLTFVTEGPYSRNVGSRTFLLDESLESYVAIFL